MRRNTHNTVTEFIFGFWLDIMEKNDRIQIQSTAYCTITTLDQPQDNEVTHYTLRISLLLYIKFVLYIVANIKNGNIFVLAMQEKKAVK